MPLPLLKKLVLISTMIQYWLLWGDKRLVIKNGWINKIIDFSEDGNYIDILENIDQRMLDIRNIKRWGVIMNR